MKINQRFYAVSVKAPVIFRQILYFFGHLFILEKIHNLSTFSLMAFSFCFGWMVQRIGALKNRIVVLV